MNVTNPTASSLPTSSNSGFRSFSATNNSVREHSQQAVIKNSVITVKSKVSRDVRASYSFPLSDWRAADRGPSANPNWNRLELIRKYTGDLDDQDGGPCQAQRIRDSQICAIKEAVAKMSAA